MTAAAVKTRDNLAVQKAKAVGLPCVLALPQLAASLEPSPTGERHEPRLLLAIDPLATLRCLALAHAPLHAPRQPLQDLRALAEWLGPRAAMLAFEARAPSDFAPRQVITLWRNSVATAIAARHLAVVRGSIDPEQAYLAGLLHDLSGWWALLHGIETPYDANRTGAEARLAHVPEVFVQRVLALDLDSKALHHQERPEAGIQREARAIAHAAGFRHPTAKGRQARSHDSATLKMVRSEFRRALDELGLATKVATPVAKGAKTALSSPARPHPGLAHALEALSHGRDGTTGNSMRAAVLAAAVHSLDFDRAFWFTVERTGKQAWLRSKLDLIPQPARALEIQCGESWRAAIGTALAGRPVVLRDPASPVLMTLGSRECVIAALNRSFHRPAILVLDRAISGRAIQDGHETSLAKALASTADLLCEIQILRRRHARAVKFSLTDPLTHVYNRGVGIASLEKEIAKARRTSSALTVLMIDLDFFKRLNDQNGHVVGDLALRRTADVLRRTVRRGDVLCRYGGEEFLAVLPGTSLEEASITATRLFTAVQQEGERLCLPLTISIGCAQMKLEAEESAESLLTRAYHALYASKATGRNRFSVDG